MLWGLATLVSSPTSDTRPRREESRLPDSTHALYAAFQQSSILPGPVYGITTFGTSTRNRNEPLNSRACPSTVPSHYVPSGRPNTILRREPADFLRPSSGMTSDNNDDLLRVNCGRCGKPLIRSVEDLRDKRTSDCDDCEKALPMRERTSRSGQSPRRSGKRTITSS